MTCQQNDVTDKFTRQCVSCNAYFIVRCSPVKEWLVLTCCAAQVVRELKRSTYRPKMAILVCIVTL